MEDVIDSVELRKAVGHHVRRLRVAKGWTQEELAAKVGISRGQLNRIENGIQAPSLETGFTLADVLDADVDDFRRIPALPS